MERGYHPRGLWSLFELSSVGEDIDFAAGEAIETEPDDDNIS